LLHQPVKQIQFLSSERQCYRCSLGDALYHCRPEGGFDFPVHGKYREAARPWPSCQRQLNIDTPIRSVIDVADVAQSGKTSFPVDAFFAITPARRFSRNRKPP
jgi:hypothetical protein